MFLLEPNHFMPFSVNDEFEGPQMHLIANLSMMFQEVPMPQRVQAARDAGFAGVEIQFPETGALEEIKAASLRCDMPVTLINVPRGTGDAVGLACLPDQEDAYHAAVAICRANARALGVQKINVLSGRPAKGTPHADSLATLERNLIYTAEVMADIDVQVMLEPVNRVDVPGFFVSGLDEGLAVLHAVDHPNLALQFDLYHMALTEPDLPAAIRRAGARIGHVQFADTRGRHEPGTGTINFAAAFEALRDTGYDGAVSAEYIPLKTTAEGLGWIKDFKRMLT
ncbi:Hydroxypyruvate isomerase [Sulfitobacter geojensis]|nr:Hydroxypyruvate isomerase [Sulfitobacter geojensis]